MKAKYMIIDLCQKGKSGETISVYFKNRFIVHVLWCKKTRNYYANMLKCQ